MRLLLDSHTILWTIYSPDRLPSRVKLLLQQDENEILVSHASVWELLSKIGRGKLLMAGRSVELALQRFNGVADSFLPITTEHISLSAMLPRHHHDPFDRILIAQSMIEKLTLITTDTTIKKYEIATIWN